eukprot:6608090-Prymnesium_polylepis.1
MSSKQLTESVVGQGRASAHWAMEAIGTVTLAMHAHLLATSARAAPIAGHAPPPRCEVPRLQRRVRVAASALGALPAGAGRGEDIYVLAVAAGGTHVAADCPDPARGGGRARNACACGAVEGGACCACYTLGRASRWLLGPRQARYALCPSGRRLKSVGGTGKAARRLVVEDSSWRARLARSRSPRRLVMPWRAGFARLFCCLRLICIAGTLLARACSFIKDGTSWARQT